jgi:tetratricopeptide (TPR) repeat protein
LFIFDNLEAFQVDAGGHFQDKHGDLSELINNIIARGFPVILTSRYPVPDFPAVQAVNLNEVAFGDFYRKAQTLKFFELRHRIGVGEEEVQRRLGQGGSDKANFKQVLSVLHTTLGGNYRALEFFDNIYQTDSRSAYDTLEELAAFSQQMANDSVKVRERLQSEAKSLVFDKLIKLLTPDELRTLQLLEPFRVPVLPEAVEMQDPSVKSLKNNLKRLFDLTLIEQHEIGDDKVEAYYVAPLVRDFLHEAKLISLDFSHKEAGDYFDKRKDTTKRVDDYEEAYYHYFAAKDKAQVNQYGRILCEHYYDKQIFHKVYNVGKQTEGFVGADTATVTLAYLGLLLQLYGKIDEALSYFEHNLIQFQAANDQENEGATLNNIGKIHFSKGDYDAALRYWEQSLAINQRIGDHKGESSTLNNISQIYELKKDYDTVLSYLEKALIIDTEYGNRNGESDILNNLGTIAYSKKDYDTALHYLKQSLDIKQQIGDHMGKGATLNNISQIYATLGYYDTALYYLEQSCAVRQEINDVAGLATTLHNMGAIFWEQQQNAKQAVPCFIQAYQKFNQIGSPNVQHTERYLEDIHAAIGAARFDAIVSAQGGVEQ